MRLFVAIDVPEHMEGRMVEIGDKLPQEGLKRVTDFHQTLKFLGDVDEDMVPKLIEALREVEHEPFDIRVTSLKAMPSTSYISMVWFLLEPEERIIDLQGKIDIALGKWFPLEKRFKPHITLTRVKFLNRKKEFLDALTRIDLPDLSFRVEEFHLVKSTLTKEGPVYETLERFQLASP